MNAIEIRGLTKQYGKKKAVNGLSLTVPAGAIYGFIGENGSGKSTLMQTILHLIKPLSGEIKTGDGLLYDEIGYLPQQTEAQKDFPASVREIVLSGNQSRCGRRPFYNKAEKEIAVENMKKMGIYDLEKRCYRELSGGQQQRVLLARALCSTQKMLLLDEPVTGLDPEATAEMYELIEELHKEGITIIMISHDVDAALKYASHILYIGKNTFFGTREEYLCWKK